MLLFAALLVLYSCSSCAFSEICAVVVVVSIVLPTPTCTHSRLSAPSTFRVAVSAVRRSESAGRRLCERATAAECDANANRGTGPTGHTALRHLTPAARESRLCIEDIGALPRNGLHTAGRHRGLQAARDHAQGGQLYTRTEATGSGHLCLGDTRQAAQRGHLRQDECAQCQFHLTHLAQQTRQHWTSSSQWRRWWRCWRRCGFCGTGHERQSEQR